MTNPVEWAHLLKDIYEHRKALCPSCGHEINSRITVGENRMGCAVLECPECGKSIEFTRIKVPENWSNEATKENT